jgi:hypothetical protein
VKTVDGCGREGVAWALVDEACGAIGSPEYARAFHAPMFRDGALVGSTLYAVDGTHVWVLDVTDQTAPARKLLVSGLGEPIATQALGSRLVIAAGREGLVLVDVSNPLAPELDAQLDLPGFALDVALEGTTAYVALGSAGIAIVDLATSTPSLVAIVATPGYATGVTARFPYAYVAACDTFAVVDLRTRAVVGTTWRKDARQNGILVAPAKDVELAGDVAFVAAGRFGAVAVDVSNPSAPSILGNCTEAAQPSFYASGVRARGRSLFVAAGEWGVRALDVTQPKTTCAMSVAPALPAPTEPAGCTSKPPWEVVPWEELWTPPPPRKDPIQTLPTAGALFAFGDARRIGVRAVDVRSLGDVDRLLGRYDEPRAVIGLAASSSRVVAIGPRGGVFSLAPDGSLTRSPTSTDALLREASAVAMLPDGRWAAISHRMLHVEGSSSSFALPNDTFEGELRAHGSRLAIVGRDFVQTYDPDKGKVSAQSIGRAELPPALASNGDEVFVAAPEWVRAQAVVPNGATRLLGPQTAFDAAEIAAPSLWRVRLPRRALAATTRGLVEIAALGNSASVVLHGAAGEASLDLAPATYAGAAAEGDRVYVTSIDRGLYRTTLSTLTVDRGRPEPVSSEIFTGVASGIASVPGRLIVADADGAIRVYRTDGPAPALLRHVPLEAP